MKIEKAWRAPGMLAWFMRGIASAAPHLKSNWRDISILPDSFLIEAPGNMELSQITLVGDTEAKYSGNLIFRYSRLDISQYVVQFTGATGFFPNTNDASITTGLMNIIVRNAIGIDFLASDVILENLVITTDEVTVTLNATQSPMFYGTVTLTLKRYKRVGSAVLRLDPSTGIRGNGVYGTALPDDSLGSGLDSIGRRFGKEYDHRHGFTELVGLAFGAGADNDAKRILTLYFEYYHLNDNPAPGTLSISGHNASKIVPAEPISILVVPASAGRASRTYKVARYRFDDDAPLSLQTIDGVSHEIIFGNDEY